MTDMENYLAAKGRDDLVKEVRRQIDAQGVEYIYYQFASVTGRIMGKGVPAKHWESMARKGFQLAAAALDEARLLHQVARRVAAQ